MKLINIGFGNMVSAGRGGGSGHSISIIICFHLPAYNGYVRQFVVHGSH